PSWFGDGQSWILAGHSFGGAQMEAFAGLLRVNMPASRISTFSYGAPRPGTVTFQERSAGINLIRWYNDTDPVPYVPPHTDEAPLLALALPDDLQLGCNRQVNPYLGRMIRPDGTTVDQ